MPDPDDHHWLTRAIDLSRSCPPSDTAFSVGAIILGTEGEVLSTGYSRETGPKDHAEEIAIAKLAVEDGALAGATIYTSLEPCSKRASRPRTCTELILAAGISRVVLAWREPLIFVDCEGVELLTAAGLDVLELPELAEAARSVNAHVLPH
ncbi:dCMP deaminase [Kribbella sp. NPDC006257]|uniref:dCMP deaminase n=1 Tax=Kribbella sp. NPDC006257 TaxID=3156738 RepID=UPI0033BBC29F